jgi:xanthine dehydrogenase YagS FAD-binding subunit
MTPPAAHAQGDTRPAPIERVCANAVQVLWPPGAAQAVRLLAALPHARVIGGGTDLVPLARDGLAVLGPLVSVRDMGLAGIALHDRRLVIGAGATLAEVLQSPLVQREAPAVVQALQASASPQVRNAATVGGNLLQRTRCPYFRGSAPACNRRLAGSGCAAREGEQRHAALFGTSEHCVAAHASDLAVALLALDADVTITGALGERRIALEALYPATATPEREHTLADGELITSIVFDTGPAARASGYLKVRDRASFQFALVSLAHAMDRADGVLRRVRLAVGGVGARPWRLRDSEAVLEGRDDGPAAWRQAAAVAGQGALPLPGNAFKLDLLERCVAHVGDPAAPPGPGCDRHASECDQELRTLPFGATGETA